MTILAADFSQGSLPRYATNATHSHLFASLVRNKLMSLRLKYDDTYDRPFYLEIRVLRAKVRPGVGFDLPGDATLSLDKP